MNLLKGKHGFGRILTIIVLGTTLVACGGGKSSDRTPNPFSFAAQTEVALETVIESNAITVADINKPVSISVTGGEYAIAGGNFTSAQGEVTQGQSVVVRLTSSDSYSTRTDATLTIGGVRGTFSVTTLADSVPDDFAFTAQSDVALSSVIESNAITVAGIEVPVSISVTGGEYSIAGGDYTAAAGEVTPGQTVVVRVTSSGSYSTQTDATLTIGGVSGTFSVTTLADSVPDDFAFTTQSDVAVSSVIESNAITVADIEVPVSISVTGGEYSIAGGEFTDVAGMVENDQMVVVRQTSSTEFETTTEAVLTIGGVSGTFSVTTMADSVPDTFAFTAQTEVPVNTVAESDSVTISGLAVASPISITGGEYSIAGGEFTDVAGTIENNQAVVVRQTTSAEVETTTEAILTIGGVDGRFATTTPGKYNFEGFTGVALNARLQTHIVTIDDIGDSTPISIENGEYSIDRGAFTSDAGFINNDQTVRVRTRVGVEYNQTTTARLNIGESWGLFNVTTKEHGDFISVWKTDNFGDSSNTQISLPLIADGTYDFTVNWGDNTMDTITAWDQAEVTHTYAAVGEYTLTITGNIEGFNFGIAAINDGSKLIEVKHWGSLRLGNALGSFSPAINLIFTGSDALDLAGLTELDSIFDSSRDFTGDVANWDVSQVVSLNGAFSFARQFNGDVSRWDVSQVTDFDNLFNGCSTFNSDISQWDVSRTIDMFSMLSNSGLSTENYSKALIAWSQLPNIQDNVSLGADRVFYNASATSARDFLINEKGWSINDNGLEP